MTRKNQPMWTAIFRRAGGDEARDMLDFLGASPLFSALSRGGLRTLSSIIHRRSYQKKEPVFRKGQPGAAMLMGGVLLFGCVGMLFAIPGIIVAKVVVSTTFRQLWAYYII